MSKNATGPRTPAGKQRSSMNARKHGFTGQSFLVSSGEQDEFALFLEDWENKLLPAGAVETELFGHLLQAAWTLRRLSRAEAALLCDAVPEEDQVTDPLTSDDAAIQNKLRLYSTYRSRAERTFHKSLAALRQIQEERLFREVVLDEDHGLPVLPRSGPIRRDILRDKQTHARQREADIEAFIFSPPPDRSHPTPPPAQPNGEPR